MNVHLSNLIPRMRKKSLNIPCRYRIVAAGINIDGIIIDITRNSHRLENRSWHAEEILIHRNPRSIKRILIARFNKSGKSLPIKACRHCQKLASDRGIIIEGIKI